MPSISWTGISAFLRGAAAGVPFLPESRDLLGMPGVLIWLCGIAGARCGTPSLAGSSLSTTKFGPAVLATPATPRAITVLADDGDSLVGKGVPWFESSLLRFFIDARRSACTKSR